LSIGNQLPICFIVSPETYHTYDKLLSMASTCCGKETTHAALHYTMDALAVAGFTELPMGS
jgi:hypothetical protein